MRERISSLKTFSTEISEFKKTISASKKDHIATSDEINEAMNAAAAVAEEFRSTSGSLKAKLLKKIAEGIEDLGNLLIHSVMSETGLTDQRVIGERSRTCNQLRLFAELLEEGSWVNARIQEGSSDANSSQKADIRKISRAIGPIAVFTASNFPLAFSTAGGDTASALAAGCPVVVKAHPSHINTNTIVAAVISKSVEECGIPKSVFSSLQGGIETGRALVLHPLTQGVAFTGSFIGGKSIMELANSREYPIPVYAEMGSINPVFILNKILDSEYGKIADTIASSVNLGAGQFCTSPGIVVVKESPASKKFVNALRESFKKLVPATMLNDSIHKAFESNKQSLLSHEAVTTVYTHLQTTEKRQGLPSVGHCSARDFILNKKLHEEIFGPFTLVVEAKTNEEVLKVAHDLAGQLTTSILGEKEELIASKGLIAVLSTKAGRVIFNGMPTGVDVCSAMHHGGPYPASSNPLHTSVGSESIKRFVRPVTFQNAPDDVLPCELKRNNPLHIIREINGQMNYQ